MRVEPAENHTHLWNRGDKRTSYDHGHDHTVTEPSEGYTDRAGMHDHRHKLPEETQ